MNCIAATTISGEFRRLPGLYRRWELPEVCAPNRSYRIEDAGPHADGTPLLAVYVEDAGDPIGIPIIAPLGGPRAGAVVDV